VSALDQATAGAASLTGAADVPPDPTPTPGPTRGFVRLWLGRAEVDRAVVFSLFTRLWQLGSAPVTLALIARNFRPDVQGYYYTFASLIALQSFFELGFQVVIVNVASHEWSRLGLGSRGEVEGDPEALSRLVSLGRLVFGWYAAAALLFVVVVTAAGFAFFSRSGHDGVAWQGPWVTQVALTGLLLWMLPFNALLEGCNQVAVVSQFRLRQAVLGNLAVWASIALGFGLWAGPVWAAVGVLRDLGLLLARIPTFVFRPNGLA
jgi:hypothetical protein